MSAIKLKKLLRFILLIFALKFPSIRQKCQNYHFQFNFFLIDAIFIIKYHFCFCLQFLTSRNNLISILESQFNNFTLTYRTHLYYQQVGKYRIKYPQISYNRDGIFYSPKSILRKRV